MNEIVKKLRIIEKETSHHKGNYDLFALFLREDSPGKWDILVSAKWIRESKQDALKFLAQKIQNSLTKDELLKISRIVIIEENNPSLGALQQNMHVEHGSAEIKDSNFFGLQIKHGYLITSRKQQAT